MFDTEKFIMEIEQRPPLYDVSSKDYSSKNIKAYICWFEVSEAMEEDWANLSTELKDNKAKEFMKKWKAIRDYFVKEYRHQKKCETGVPASKKKKYLYYDQLSFLVPHVKGNTHTQTNIPAQDVEEAGDVNELADGEPMSVTDDNISGVRQQSAIDAHERQRRQSKAKNYRLDIAKTISSTSKSLTDILTQTINIRKQEMTSDKYGNKAFLNSFVPMMDNFPPNVAAYAIMKISELFNQIANEHVPLPPVLNVPGSMGSSYTSINSSRSETPPQESSLQEMDEFNLSNYIILN